MKIVLDTNVFISGIFWKGTPRKILELWVHGKIQIVITKSIFEEYINVMRRFDREGTTVKRWESFTLENSEVLEEKIQVKICRDPDDDKFLNCALLSGADYLVSGDDDLLLLKIIGTTKIVKAAQLLKNF